MKLSELKPNIPKKKRKRVGRGDASGTGGTSGKGHKGQKSRSGAKIRIGFEGGQMSLLRRLPKRGFKNFSAKNYQTVNLDMLNKFNKNEIVNPKSLKEKNMIRNQGNLIKVLGDGELSCPLEINAHAFSKSAKEKIEKAGGKIIFIK
ncbi:MAG: 50S ribosomal protein L15 [Candidatus Omnitrophota bacterium]